MLYEKMKKYLDRLEEAQSKYDNNSYMSLMRGELKKKERTI
jgi:acetyl-CoA carboxylase beta subunit